MNNPPLLEHFWRCLGHGAAGFFTVNKLVGVFILRQLTSRRALFSFSGIFIHLKKNM
jgi:hypothetical protein